MKSTLVLAAACLTLAGGCSLHGPQSVMTGFEAGNRDWAMASLNRRYPPGTPEAVLLRDLKKDGNWKIDRTQRRAAHRWTFMICRLSSWIDWTVDQAGNIATIGGDQGEVCP